MSNPEHRLYIILRQDMASMTAGRCAAMASHATSLFEMHSQNCCTPNEKSNLVRALTAWKSETPYNFGTTIVLQSPDLNTLGLISQKFDQLVRSDINGSGTIMGAAVIDPEYVLVDGSVIHLIPDVQVGMYVFANEADATKLGLKELKLL